MDWTKLISAVIAALTDYFGADFGAFLQKIFDMFFKANPPSPIITVGMAPDEVRASLRQRVLDFVAGALANFGLLRRLALNFISKRIDGIINGAWDSLFPDAIAKGDLPAAASFKVATMATVDEISPADLAKCKAEAGLSA